MDKVFASILAAGFITLIGVPAYAAITSINHYSNCDCECECDDCECEE